MAVQTHMARRRDVSTRPVLIQPTAENISMHQHSALQGDCCSPVALQHVIIYTKHINGLKRNLMCGAAAQSRQS